VKYLCLLAVLLTLPVPATAQQRRGDDRRTGDRGSSERGTADRGSNDRGAGDRSKGDRGGDDRGTSGSTRFNPTVPSWEQNQVPWWERQGAPWWERRQSPTTTTTTNRNTHYDQRDHRGYRNNNGGVLYVVPAYPYFQETRTTVVQAPPPSTTVITRAAEPPPAPVAIGFLNLEVEPRELLQIYVDGVYVGTPADLGNELKLTPGVRKIELRARGYKTVTFSAEIVEDRSISYRATLDRDDTAPAAPSQPAIIRPPAASGPTTMYMIQGCYLGNIAPKQTELRAGCDISKLTTFRP
jgi:hypothetical protein